MFVNVAADDVDVNEDVDVNDDVFDVVVDDDVNLATVIVGVMCTFFLDKKFKIITVKQKPNRKFFKENPIFIHSYFSFKITSVVS